MSVITDLAAAIKRQEGFFPGSAAYRYNNPGNLMDPNNRIWPQYPKAASGEVIFPDQSTGQAALENDLSIKVNRGMTLTLLLNMYAPSSENDTAAYISNVSTWTGLPTDVPLNRVSGEETGGIVPSFNLDALFGSPEAPGYQEAGLSGGLLVGLIIAGIAVFLIACD